MKPSTDDSGEESDGEEEHKLEKPSQPIKEKPEEKPKSGAELGIDLVAAREKMQTQKHDDPFLEWLLKDVPEKPVVNLTSSGFVPTNTNPFL